MQQKPKTNKDISYVKNKCRKRIKIWNKSRDKDNLGGPTNRNENEKMKTKKWERSNH